MGSPEDQFYICFVLRISYFELECEALLRVSVVSKERCISKASIPVCGAKGIGLTGIRYAAALHARRR
jgi:hypothetical protein